MKAVLVFLFFSCLFVAIQGADEELLSWTSTVTLPAGNDNTCPLPWKDGNVCAGSNSNLCLGTWDGVFTFLDQTPSDAVWMGLQFTLFGSFGCGELENTTEIIFKVNGVEYMDWYLDPSAWTCGCPIVADTEIAYRVFSNTTNDYATTYKYEIGKTNQATLDGIDVCVCAIEVTGYYIGAPVSSSSPGGLGAVGITFIVLGILAVIVIVAVLAVIGFLYYKKRTAYTTL